MNNPFLKTYSYQWIHLPSGKVGVRARDWLTRQEFLEDLANWNRLGGELWKYHEVEHELRSTEPSD